MRSFLALAILATLSFVPTAIAKEYVSRARPAAQPERREIVFAYATDELWGYLRRGLCYLESPTPLLPPEAVKPGYVHPDGRGFGAYGFSPEAYEDVQRLYPFFRAYSFGELLKSQRLYDLANQAFCDWMLKSLQSALTENPSKEKVFEVIHQAWNLGVGGYKSGRTVVASRSRRAKEFLLMANQG